ncbi:hypothetical protein A7981_10750 [Methylovorus sp. MM2]|uniref:O-antigen ligase family protein n=1 Tax=Methylovorus sp. MM2 TaxID=1848038 RepID=UPI0007DE877D|nr:O-antigen ligase family protein [Methylovorus sp. MM2]OAM51209.1 hypothetical protein A7981_10750 [Methylovorus sp. MM2]
MDIFTAFLIFAFILCVAVACLIALVAAVIKFKPIFWASISTLTSTVQLYIFPLPGFYLSASLLTGLLSVKSLLNLNQTRFLWVYAFLLMEVFRGVSLLWSPKPIEGIRYLIYEIVFIFIVIAFSNAANIKAGIKERVIKISLTLVGLNAILVILFRLGPEIEMNFLNSVISQFFISKNVLSALLTYSPNNVFDPSKAGGFFINANVGAAYMGMAAMGAWFFGKALKSKLLISSAVLCWIAVFFAGSKAAIIVAATLPLLLFVINIVFSNTINLKHLLVLLGLVFMGSLAWIFGHLFFENSEFFTNSTSTLDDRIVMWTFAANAFAKHPFLGLGFGGWDIQSAGYAFMNGYRTNLPAHNAYLILWSQSGLLAALAGLVFSVSLVAFLIKALTYNTGREALIVKGVLGAVLWVFFQAQGENFGLIGEAHITPLLAMMIGYAISQGCFQKKKKSTDEKAE